jgi:UDP-N-acetyl-D-mannosaminuronic acid dehydrogenase/UDP-N-acetyl-D-glucosamine dehydrogenase
VAQRVVVVGQGFIGLTVAVRAAQVGFEVVGFDTDTERVQRLREGEPGVDTVGVDDLAAVQRVGSYRPTADPAELAGFAVAVVSVPTPLRDDGSPDFRPVERAADLLAPHVAAGCCVVLESTVRPGATEEVFLPRLAAQGLHPGVDFHAGYSPQRIDPGNPTWTFRATPKLVAGIDGPSLAAISGFYMHLVDEVVPVATIKEAELAKLLENTFRQVNIALVNELAVYCHGIGVDVWSVIDAAASKPFGFLPFTPGPGAGGHPVPWREELRMTALASEVNDGMPDYVMARAVAHLQRRAVAVDRATVLLIGLSYKRNCAAAANSPALRVATRLVESGAEVLAVDPMISPAIVPAGVTLVGDLERALASADLAIVLTDHDAIDWTAVSRHTERVLDTRNRLRHPAVERL